MTSAKKKGQKKELLAQKQLEAEGYNVIFRSMTVKLGPIFMGLDIADLFDIVALKIKTYETGLAVPYWYFISVKHHNSSGLGRHKSNIRHFAARWGLCRMMFELWRWKRPGFYGRGKARAWCKGEFERQVIA